MGAYFLNYKKPTFADYVEINAIDTLKDPVYPTQKIMDYFFFTYKTICSDCKTYKTFKLIKNKKKGDSFTILCRCKCIIIYPESKERSNCRLWVEIPKEKFQKKGKNNG